MQSEALNYWQGTIRGNRSIPSPPPIGVKIDKRESHAKFADGSAITWNRRTGEVLGFVESDRARLAAALPSIAPHHSPAEHDRTAERIARDIGGCGVSKPYVWCSTHSSSPRKHAHPEPAEALNMDVTLGHGIEDRIVTAKWKSGGICAMVSIDVATMRKMIAAAEAYKPGATLSRRAQDIPTHQEQAQ